MSQPLDLDQIETRAAEHRAALSGWLNCYSPLPEQEALEGAEGVLKEDVPELANEVRRLHAHVAELRIRAEQAEELQRIAHETSNKSEAERAKAARRADKAEALLLHFTAEAHRRKWEYDRGLSADGVPIKSEAFDALHRLGEEMRAELEKLRATARP